ncbi:MAG: ATP-binding cassette domain-containing protein [Deltaproteobacteria bacterium]|nr:MAG: ATP-binding cassette domain-containing protein [Deltaproteobacteria bacterium]
MIEVEDLQKSFKRVRALDGVSFTAQDGRITGLLGPNGAGKTTTLRILYTLMRPDGGSAHVDRFDVVREVRAVQQRIGVLPESRGLYPRLTARENIRYYGELQGQRGETLERNIEEMIELLDMREIADRRTDGFSQGERLKVAIARALIHHPQNILLDEPTNGLDVMSTRAMRTIIRRFREKGKCVVLSTHIMQEISALCDDIVVISHGRVVATGTPDELRAQTGRENLEDAFVAVIGSEEGLML